MDMIPRAHARVVGSVLSWAVCKETLDWSFSLVSVFLYLSVLPPPLSLKKEKMNPCVPLPCIHISLESWQNCFKKFFLTFYILFVKFQWSRDLPIQNNFLHNWQNISVKCLYIFCHMYSTHTHTHTHTQPTESHPCLKVVAVRLTKPCGGQGLLYSSVSTSDWSMQILP